MFSNNCGHGRSCAYYLGRLVEQQPSEKASELVELLCGAIAGSTVVQHHNSDHPTAAGRGAKRAKQRGETPSLFYIATSLCEAPAETHMR